VTTYVWRKGRVVDKAKAAPRHTRNDAAYVISDEMPETRHMATGAWMTSKHKFRQATKDAGCIEVGNDPSMLPAPRRGTFPSREERRHQIRQTLRGMLRGDIAQTR